MSYIKFTHKLSAFMMMLWWVWFRDIIIEVICKGDTWTTDKSIRSIRYFNKNMAFHSLSIKL